MISQYELLNTPTMKTHDQSQETFEDSDCSSETELAMSPVVRKRNIVRLEFPAAWAHSVLPELTAEAPVASEKTDDALERLKLKVLELEEENLRKIIEERETARAEERAALERNLEEKLVEDRAAIARIEEKFLAQKRRYFEDVEKEVVKLALAIATRIVHREIKLDPALLQGAVHVALEKIEDESTVKLRVPVSDLPLWREVFERSKHTSFEVLGDETMVPGDCVVETTMGRVDLGVKSQLEEIERGFFDLLERRPS